VGESAVSTPLARRLFDISGRADSAFRPQTGWDYVVENLTEQERAFFDQQSDLVIQAMLEFPDDYDTLFAPHVCDILNKVEALLAHSSPANRA